MKQHFQSPFRVKLYVYKEETRRSSIFSVKIKSGKSGVIFNQSKVFLNDKQIELPKMMMVTNKRKWWGEERKRWKNRNLSDFRYKFYIQSEIKLILPKDLLKFKLKVTI